MVNAHAITRWSERVQKNVTDVKGYIEQLFRNHHYIVVEPAKKGRLIVQIKNYMFVISRTNSSTIIHTTFGSADDYEIKRPHAVLDREQCQLDKWTRHQYIANIRNRR